MAFYLACQYFTCTNPGSRARARNTSRYLRGGLAFWIRKKRTRRVTYRRIIYLDYLWQRGIGGIDIAVCA